MAKTRSRKFGMITIILILLFSLAGSAISHLFWHSRRFINEPLHATVEAVGAVAALSLGVIILILRRYREDYIQYLWVACAFIGMGTLDIFHALAPPESITFVWFRSTATLAGGFLFALTFLPEQVARSRHARLITALVVAFVILFGALSLIFHDALPAMEHAGYFTKTAKAINICGGIFFMMTATRFFVRFTSRRLAGELIFSNLCVLLGTASFLFIYSSQWTTDWWFWHILRLTAYLVVLSYAFNIFQRSQEELKRNVEALDSEIISRKRIENELRESEERYRRLFETSKDGILLLDKQTGNIIKVNPAAGELLGYSSEELSEKNIKDIMKDPIELQRAMRELNEVGFIFYEDVPVEAKGGLCINADIYLINRAKMVQCNIRDITERKRGEEARKRLEQQLLQSQKMEAIGQLAGGIAHDFNNILTAIIGYADLVKAALRDDDPSKAYAGNVLALADRAATLTQGLLAFSRKQVLDQRPVDMNEIIKRMEKILSRIIGEDIVFRTDLTAGALIVFADTGQMEQVVMNLAANARDAMPHGGTLTIGTLRIGLDEEFIKLHGYGKPGDYAVVSISDTGTGMNEKTRQRIFEPFFTTKELGKGTGLGLSIVYGIIKQHNGYIDVYSEIGKGTNFKIYLPVIKAEAEVAKAAVVIPSRGAETILLAEDEPAVRNSTKIILERYGYKVIEASDGEEAVKKFEENKDVVQLLLIDVVMPKKNGRKAHEEIIRMRPDVKAIFISGYTANIMYEKGLLEKGLAFVSKPIAPTDLLKKIREVLDTNE